jgi:hypothetical protein
MTDLERMVQVYEDRIEAIPVSKPTRAKAGYIQLPCGRIVSRLDRKELKRLKKELEKEREEATTRFWSNFHDQIVYAIRKLSDDEEFRNGDRSVKCCQIANQIFGCGVKMLYFDNPFNGLIAEFKFGAIYGELCSFGWKIVEIGTPYFREGKKCELRYGEYVLATGTSEDGSRPTNWDYGPLLEMMRRIWNCSDKGDRLITVEEYCQMA